MGMHHSRAKRGPKTLTYIKHTLPSDLTGMQAAKREWNEQMRREAAARKGGRPKGSTKRKDWDDMEDSDVCI